MGASGRPTFTAHECDDAEDFFTNSIKIWKEKVGL